MKIGFQPDLNPTKFISGTLEHLRIGAPLLNQRQLLQLLSLLFVPVEINFSICLAASVNWFKAKLMNFSQEQ
ncbi:hypothetical protein Cni_G18221 [Canna indica]|uniref:Uncharacterized protein n=1 Tax=Canna indica TaxID=4628 RepID=A0AAQ3KIG3_9LILI|nr:hypothetical protein Cni_G18221 [Canna indica]